uniref:Uncharacterized protein n=1 Tax=Knipowitschia caucasica TaxID=637954 RepID=A0AAV2L4D0_KNICA
MVLFYRQADLPVVVFERTSHISVRPLPLSLQVKMCQCQWVEADLPVVVFERTSHISVRPLPLSLQVKMCQCQWVEVR